ncbi:hypothetical protein LCGC14_2462160 [marine sediment metagenome]|uniref:Uncharacterized protein n=1 Tax=marine sediment metagenome TaxID=412755 RepID=A0A0F9C0N4_9ZZZZ
MVFLELAIASQFKRIKNNRFVKPIIEVAKQIDPDRTLKKLQQQRRN